MRKILRKGLLFQLSLLLVLCGCGSGDVKDVGADIVLLDPPGAVSDYETAAYRNLYDAEVFSAGVFPAVREYAYDDGQIFSCYGALPGETVQKGDVLQSADFESIDEQIADMEEKLADMEEEYAEYVEEMQEQIAEAEENTALCKEVLDEYNESSSRYFRVEGQYKMAVYQEEGLKQQLLQKQQLYELDYAYEEAQLQSLKEERREGILRAKEDGTVVATGFYSSGDWVEEKVSVAAVADLEQKIIKSEYVSPAQAAKAEEMYACIDGRKYEIVYQPLETGEYAALTEQGAELYSTFLLLGDTGEIETGDYAVVVLLYNSREEVVSVSREAIHRDGNGAFVYLYRDGESVYTSVKTGMSDGVYTEIVSGLSAGDQVLVEQNMEYGDRTTQVERSDFSDAFGGRGYLYYPSVTLVRNEVNYGTVYFLERKVSLYQHVEKGDVIATVRVEKEESELVRVQTELTRAEERLADYKLLWEEYEQSRDVENATSDERKLYESKRKAYEKEVENRQEAIEELRQTLEEMQSDFSTKEIVAQVSGIITWVCDYRAEDILSKDSHIASIADEDTCYILVENTGQMLNIGTQADISYKDAQGDTCQAQGTVATVSNAGVSPDLRADYALIKVEQAPEEMTATVVTEDGSFNRRAFSVAAVVREMDDVLLVPNAAVTERNGHTYVNVVQEDGSVVARSFIAGGSDMEYYWVIDGLEEGMKLCYK
ncbi:MAG: hypothetical protein ACI4TB_05880 [Lachnospiraceae bacterium]